MVKGLGIGGAETLISDSAPFWDLDSFEYKVAYLLPRKNQLVPDLEANGVDVECLDWRRPPGWAALRRLRNLGRHWRPDVVHSHLPAAGVMGRLTLTGTSHVYTEHNIVDSYRQPTRWLNRVTYGRNRAVIAVSEAVARSIQGYRGPEPHVIPNGVSVRVTNGDRREVRAELGIDAGTRLVVHVGNIRPHKGHENLIHAVDLLRREIPNVLVVSIGGEKYEGDLSRVRGMARKAGLANHLRFLGRRRDARSFIAAADVVVNPADVEGLPVSVLEALALKRPVVATAVGGVPTVVRHEVSGLLVPPADPGRLAEALARALTSSEASRWGAEGAHIVRRDHSLDQMVKAYESVYRMVLNE